MKLLDAVSILLKKAVAIIVASACFSFFWGMYASFHSGALVSAPIEAMLLFNMVLPAMVLLGLPLQFALYKFFHLSKNLAATSAFSISLVGSFLFVTFLSRSRAFDTGRTNYNFWIYQIGEFPNLIGIVILMIAISSLCGLLYLKISEKRTSGKRSATVELRPDHN